jgi:NADH:ubiquinone oxidoreductase subunit K
LLLAAGFYALAMARDLVRALIAIQLMVKAAMLALVAAGGLTGRMALGQSLGITVILADTVAVVIGLSLAVAIKSRTGALDIDDIINTGG